MEKPSLGAIQAELLQMGQIVQQTVRKSIQSLKDHDEKMALEIINQDDIVDNLLVVMEEKVALALSENPTPHDLRCLLSILKIANNLERVADYATNISEIVLEFKDEQHIKPLVHIPHLSRIALNMLDVSLQAFVDMNSDLAEAVCKKDEEADNLYEEIHRELVGMMNEADSRTVRQALHFLLVARYLERIADHATNIGEETIYTATGKRVQY